MGPAGNRSSLALKGGIGIHAMAEISNLVGRDGSVFRQAAQLYMQAWEKLSTSTSIDKHLVFSYGHDSSWMLAYNLYAEQYETVRTSGELTLLTLLSSGSSEYRVFLTIFTNSKARSI